MPTRTPTDHLAENIKAIREARGLSQQQIAKAAGIPRGRGRTSSRARRTRPRRARQGRERARGPARRAARAAAPTGAVPARRGATGARARPGDHSQADPGAAAQPRSRADDAAPGGAHGRRAAHARHARVPRVRARHRRARGRGRALHARRRRRGDLPGDQRHAYHNPGKSLAVAFSAIAFAPVGA